MTRLFVTAARQAAHAGEITRFARVLAQEGTWLAMTRATGSHRDSRIAGDRAADRSVRKGIHLKVIHCECYELHGELSPAADADLLEHRRQVLLDCVSGDVQLADDLTCRVSLQDQRDDAHLRWRKAVGTEKQGAELRR